ncbi:MAG: endolytic transglycosylase MltG [Candidatus Gracilibacteria bacterium]
MYHHSFTPKIPKKFTKSRIAFAVLGILVLGLILLCFRYQSQVNKAVDPTDTTQISIIIKKGDSVDAIRKKLSDANLIESPFSFGFYVSFHELDTKILAGRFLLSKSMTLKQIAENITDMENAEFMVTIQEGLQIRDVDQKLVDLELIKPGEFIQEVKNFSGWEYYSFLDKEILSKLELPVEGYLYPDTYFLDPSDFKPHDLIYLALDNFEKKTADLLPQLKNHSVHQIITMASIIENEVFGAENRKIVSGILWKRLENNWPLGADITLLYTKDDRKITSEDLASDSPYNTRKHQGLPPGPISNPSLESIEAAMFPKESPYWFYLTEPENGEVIYSKTNEEHNQNRAKYL